MPPRIITIKLSTITLLVSRQRQSNTQLRLSSIVNWLTNIRRLPTRILKNDNSTAFVFYVCVASFRQGAPAFIRLLGGSVLETARCPMSQLGSIAPFDPLPATFAVGTRVTS